MNALPTNGIRPDGIEFRTLWVLSTSHITKDNLDGILGPNHCAQSWPVRSLEENVLNVYVSDELDSEELDFDPHIVTIFQYARENQIRELRFDADAARCPLFPAGGDHEGFLNPHSPEYPAKNA